MSEEPSRKRWRRYTTCRSEGEWIEVQVQEGSELISVFVENSNAIVRFDESDPSDWAPYMPRVLTREEAEDLVNALQLAIFDVDRLKRGEDIDVISGRRPNVRFADHRTDT